MARGNTRRPSPTCSACRGDLTVRHLLIARAPFTACLVLLLAALGGGCSGTRAPERNPDPASFLAQGEAFLDAKDYDRAIALFDLALEADPLQASALLGRGNAWRAKGNTSRALADYNAALNVRPQYAAALVGRGLIWHERNNYDRAIADFDAAIQSDPDDAWAFNSRGNSWYRKNRLDRAMADYDEAIRLSPDYAQAYFDRANAWAAKQDYDQAIADYDAALRFDPQHFSAFHNRGSARYLKHEYDRAIADYTSAVGLNPSNAGSFHDRGEAWRRKGELERALADYDAAIALSPSYFNARRNRGLVRFQTARFAGAADDFAIAMRLEPNAYGALWLFLSRERSGADGGGELLRHAQELRHAAWPRPIIAFYLGQSSAEELRDAANNSARDPAERRCEANFFTAQRLLIKREPRQAEQLFKAALGECKKGSWEYEAAVADLERMQRDKGSRWRLLQPFELVTGENVLVGWPDLGLQHLLERSLRAAVIAGQQAILRDEEPCFAQPRQRLGGGGARHAQQAVFRRITQEIRQDGARPLGAGTSVAAARKLSCGIEPGALGCQVDP